MLPNVTYKRVYGADGDFQALELWQGNDHITISLGAIDMDVLKNSPKWNNIKRTIDAIAKDIA